MSKGFFLHTCALSAIAIVNATPALAQTANEETAATAPVTAPVAPQGTPADTQTEIIVTGSIIRGAPQNTALPVTVIGADELQKQGAPLAVELFKTLPIASGSLGDSNAADARSQAAEGIASVNLRGLGSSRTLVLLNNHRLVTSGNGVPAVDINLLPTAAIGRIEVLKDGASAIYGSDAVAGVVNFITRTKQEGFRVSGSYRFVEDTKGDVDASISYGHVGEQFRFLAAFGYTDRGRLLPTDRDFASRSYVENPQGGWSAAGNPGNFMLVGANPTLPGRNTALGGIVADAGCSSLGGYVGVGNNRCYMQGVGALVDREKRFTAYMDLGVDLTDSVNFRTTALYGHTSVPDIAAAPSNPMTQLPSSVALGGTNPYPVSAAGALQSSGFFVPASNPGFVAYKAAHPGQFAGAAANATGAVLPLLLFRPLGDAAADDLMRSSSRDSDSARFTAEFSGNLSSNIQWSVAGTYHEYVRNSRSYDTFGDRVQLALRGFGGPSCNLAANTPGANGCLWLNPLSSADPAAGGTTVANSADLINWLAVPTGLRTTSTLAVLDANVSGSTGIHLPGGDVQFGIGAQYRYGWYDAVFSRNNSLAANPCRDTPITGNLNPAACAPTALGPANAAGALGFFGSGVDQSTRGGVKAVFAEVQLPILESLNVQGAIRYEDYGGQVGSTIDPQLRARWEVTDWFSLRGGIGTTFRGPTPNELSGAVRTSLQLVGASFTPVDVYGNPGLKPETTTNYSAGALVKLGGFNASVDYFGYNIHDVIIGPPLSGMVATLFPTGQPNTCAQNPTLAARFTFNTGACTATTSIANITRVKTVTANGASQTNEGFDISVNYRAREFLGSAIRLGIGADATRTLHNRISAVSVEGVEVAPAFDGVGRLNFQSSLYALPKWKGQAYLDLGAGRVDTRVTLNYVGGLHDQRYDSRTGPFAPNCALGLAPGVAPGTPCVDTGLKPNAASNLSGADLPSVITTDFNIQVKLPWRITLTGTVFNVFDVDPPFAREQYGYEPFVSNPYGRMVKIGLSAEF